MAKKRGRKKVGKKRGGHTKVVPAHMLGKVGRKKSRRKKA